MRSPDQAKSKRFTRIPKLFSRIRTDIVLRPKFRLDVQQSVVLDYPLAAAGGAGFQVAGAEAHDEVGDEVVRCLAGSVGDEDAPAVAEG